MTLVISEYLYIYIFPYISKHQSLSDTIYELCYQI